MCARPRDGGDDYALPGLEDIDAQVVGGDHIVIIVIVGRRPLAIAQDGAANRPRNKRGVGTAESGRRGYRRSVATNAARGGGGPAG
jgi:hypothetical protein